LSIRIFYDEVDFRLNGSGKALKVINKVIGKEKKISGDLSFIFTDDETIKKINIEFLEHDYNTDVIAFNYNVGDVLNGEIYISIETVKKNANNYNISLKMEIMRVMIHGILHLTGYDDKNENEKEGMRKMEDRWLREFESDKNGY